MSQIRVDAAGTSSQEIGRTTPDMPGHKEDAGEGNHVSVLIFHHWPEVAEIEGNARLGVEEGEVAVCVEDGARVVLGSGIGIIVRHYGRGQVREGGRERAGQAFPCAEANNWRLEDRNVW